MSNEAEKVKQAVDKALVAAGRESNRYFQEVLGGKDQYACGFAWVNVYGVKGSTRLGKALLSNGFRKSYTGGLQYWNPSNLMVQNVDTLEAGAQAFAKVIKEELGVTAYAGSRLD